MGTARLGSLRVRVCILTLSLLSPVTLAMNFPKVSASVKWEHNTFHMVVTHTHTKKIKYNKEVVSKIIFKIHPVAPKR